MAGPDVAALAADLARAVELTMSPTAAQADRLKAYNACESFKETSPLCAEAGLFLAAGTQHSILSRHFGLQLMEHTVKYRWTQISQNEKLFIKENAMKLLAAGGISDEPHMKDALSRVVVEMVKREWPQQWPGLLAELSDACVCGEIQTELVLMVFLRLVEDVALLQTLESNQRRKDIYQALTTNMAVIFEFFLQLIELHVGQFRVCSETENQPKAAAHGRVVQVVLLTLTGFVEWVSMSHIMARNGRLLQILCLLLNDNSFQCPAAECLSQIVNRKGKLEERKSLMFLFNDEAIQCLVSAAKVSIITLNEQDYLFKKKLIQILCGIGTQLCSLWGKDGMQRPSNYSLFLDAILAFSSHPSLTLSHLANPLWNSMMKHEHISRDQVFLSYIPQWVQCTAPKLIKLTYPTNKNSNNPNEAASYTRFEFDSEEEYSIYFHRCKSDFSDSFRQATVIAPIVTFSYAEQWLIKCLQVPNITGVNTTDPVYLEWEALSNCLESILSRVLQAQERPSVQSGLTLLQMCLTYQPVDPLILSTLLTCISALFVFLSMSSGHMAPAINSVAMSGASLLPQVLEKIFSALVYSPPGQSKDSRSRAVKNVRRHAASLMVKIGVKYPLLLLPVFDQIRVTVDNLSHHNGPAQLSMLERVTLQEALLLISNHFCDYDRQSTFVREVMREANVQWTSIANSGAFKGAVEFMNFVGLNKTPVSGDDPCGINRSNLVYCVNLLLGTVKRCNWPEDPERATRGGFVVALTEAGNPVCRNPAAPHIVPLLPHILSLIRIFNEIFTPEAQAILHDGFKGCLNMQELEKANLLGLVGHVSEVNDTQTNISTLERMQRFLCGLHESCYHLMGSVGSSLGRDLYSLPDLGPAIVTSVLACLQYIPDYRLRPIIRVFLKAFIYSCPQPFYEVVLLPIMAYLAPLMVSRLNTKWQQVSELRGKEAQDDNADAQEVLEDILTRALTREYIDLLKVALVGGSLTPENNQDTMETEDLSMDAPTPTRTNLSSEVISDLGTLLLRSEKTCQSLVLTVLGTLSWIDSNASLKATFLTGPIIRLLVADNTLNGEMAAHIMAAVLNGLTLHGQHDVNQGSLLTLGAQIYELLRPTFPEVYAVMQQIPGINPVDLQKLDERISGQTSKGNKVEKVKKDLFKKITSTLIGRSVGQLFKKEVKIQDLPRLAIPERSVRKEVIPDLRNIFSA
ncbi:PREDICTED: exportin-5 [Nicrophorus vespilloides]|uniref:Exportin-5 n=1 Tax=Nicrophorus vespilloides TaxID=110193 RepID=A0ABM1M8B5_NICVS|nr:PREDICTED: exportin-5 [Nicrophorus vespilloides]XP_017770816.1 PREDICTED: exportin-5 [Nicrophorus vespilloides]XP_017770817.1 PREDICTED: exportin-5 [Nicrophorus vespilloides]